MKQLRRCSTHIDYVVAISNAYFRSAGAQEAALEHTRLRARLARSNAEASADRLAAEPVTDTKLVNSLNAILAGSHDFVHAVMALETGLSLTRTGNDIRALEAFSGEVIETLHTLSSLLRGAQFA